jgi:hypothetical protein
MKILYVLKGVCPAMISMEVTAGSPWESVRRMDFGEYLFIEVYGEKGKGMVWKVYGRL